MKHGFPHLTLKPEIVIVIHQAAILAATNEDGCFMIFNASRYDRPGPLAGTVDGAWLISPLKKSVCYERLHSTLTSFSTENDQNKASGHYFGHFRSRASPASNSLVLATSDFINGLLCFSAEFCSKENNNPRIRGSTVFSHQLFYQQIRLAGFIISTIVEMMK